jgi:hypothetical protein
MNPDVAINEAEKALTPADPDIDRPLTEEEMKRLPFHVGEMFPWKGIWWRVKDITLKTLILEPHSKKGFRG